jgi:hypothetical protein
LGGIRNDLKINPLEDTLINNGLKCYRHIFKNDGRQNHKEEFQHENK